jgi:glycerophosphoryl diester phosphodiesterase
VIGLRFVPGFRPRGSRVQIPPRSGIIDLTAPRFVDRCHRQGLGIDYWVINHPAEARRLIDRGADGIVTDDPAAIAGAIRTS